MVTMNLFEISIARIFIKSSFDMKFISYDTLLYTYVIYYKMHFIMYIFKKTFIYKVTLFIIIKCIHYEIA